TTRFRVADTRPSSGRGRSGSPGYTELRSSITEFKILSVRPTKEVGNEMNARFFSFIGGVTGAWRVVNMSTIVGAPLPDVTRLDLGKETPQERPDGKKWVRRGHTSSELYVPRSKKHHLAPRQPPLGRPHATCAALIPIRKAASWWDLAQDE